MYLEKMRRSFKCMYKLGIRPMYRKQEEGKLEKKDIGQLESKTRLTGSRKWGEGLRRRT